MSLDVEYTDTFKSTRKKAVKRADREPEGGRMERHHSDAGRGDPAVPVFETEVEQ